MDSIDSNVRFYSHLRKVAVVHIAVVILFLFWGILGNFFTEKDEIVMPIQFMVAAPASTMSVNDKRVSNPVIKRETVEPKPKTKTKPKPKQKVRVNNERVVRNPSNNIEPTKLSPEEIERRLKMGAKVGAKDTAIPDEDSRGYLLIKQTLYDLWMPPDKEVVGDNFAKVTLKLSANGTIIYKNMVESSGIQQMDSSISALLNAVVRIPGLPAGFLARHSNESVTITFKVQ